MNINEAAGILKEKVEELCRLVPGLINELDMTRGKTRTGKDDVTYIFKNGSKLDIMAASQKSRGKRKTGGLVEECILVDKTLLNEVIIPTMNVDRRLPDGTRREDETTNKSQIFVTTAGWKNSFAETNMFIGETLKNSVNLKMRVWRIAANTEWKQTVCQACA